MKILKKLLDFFRSLSIINFVPRIEDLCNGSTPDSDSVCGGSNPSSSAIKHTQPYSWLGVLFCIDRLRTYQMQRSGGSLLDSARRNRHFDFIESLILCQEKSHTVRCGFLFTIKSCIFTHNRPDQEDRYISGAEAKRIAAFVGFSFCCLRFLVAF